MSEGQRPRGRCGYTWTPAGVGQGEASHQHCCYRETWRDYDHCIWHAEVGPGVVKPVEELEAAREPQAIRDRNYGVYGAGDDTHATPAELLCGAFLTGVSIAGRLSFSRCWLAAAELRNADLSGTDLTGAYLWRTDLRRANLRGSVLIRAEMKSATLSGADLCRANLTSADLMRASLPGADLSDATLTDANCNQATLDGATLERADLSEAGLADATLDGARMVEAALPGANLRDATLSEAELSEADLAGAYLWRADLSGAHCYDVALERANLGGADLSGAHCWEADLTGANCYDADLTGAYLRDAECTKAYLREADLVGTNLEGAVVTRADLLGADLTDAKLYGATLTEARINRRTRFFPETPSGGRRCAYDPGNPRTDDGGSDDHEERLAKAADTYRELETLAQGNSFAGLQSEMFVRRQDMQTAMLREDGDWPSFVFARVSRAVLKYGESYARVLLWAIGIVVGFAVLYPLGNWIRPVGSDGRAGEATTWGRILGDPPAFWESLYYSTLTFTPGGTPNFQPVGAVAQALTAAETAIGAFLLALLVFVFGRRAAR